MPNTIKLKRSTSTANPTGLSNGELAWTESGNVLFIGSFDGTTSIAIAGKRFPGTLTANQSIVVDANKMIDTVMVGNSTVNVVANSSTVLVSNSSSPYTTTIIYAAIQVGNSTQSTTMWANQIMVANSTYGTSLGNNSVAVGNTVVNTNINATAIWLANSTVTWTLIKPTAAQVTAANYFPASDGTWKQATGGSGSPGGSNTNIQFNDSTAFAGSNNLTWNKTSNTLSLSGNLVANADYISVGNSTVNSVINSTAHVMGTSVVNTSGYYINGFPTALYKLSNGTLSSVSSVSINLASYGTWAGYRIAFDSIVLSAANLLFVNVSSDGITYYANSATRAASINNTAQAIVNDTTGKLPASNLSTTPSYIILETHNPSTTTGTAHEISYEIYNHANSYISGFISSVNASFTSLGGIKISSGGATFSGNYSVYGYL